jgi:hypothetical protein
VRVQRQDRVEDDLVLGDVEVDRPHLLDRVGHGVLAEEHAADGALLGEEVVRRRALVTRALVALVAFAGETQMGDGHVRLPSVGWADAPARPF